MEYEATKDPIYWAGQLEEVLKHAKEYGVGGLCAVVFEDAGSDSPIVHAPVVNVGLTNTGIVTCKHLIAKVPVNDDDGG